MYYTCRYDEGVWIVSEMNSRMRANMENVLRAMDVIPPFDSHGAPGGAGLEPEPGLSPAPMFAVEGAEPRQASASVPTLDLGEKILAEQRRRTARKRRAPGSLETSPELGLQSPTTPTERLAKPSGDDLTELQRLVSDIVARDIARLYEGIQRPSSTALRS